MLTLPIINFPFKFNNESTIWITENKESMYNIFDAEFPENGGFWFNNPEHPKSKEFQSTPPARQITDFLKNLGLSEPYVHIAIYKPESERISSQIESLHIDAPQYRLLPARFNVLVEGDSLTKMHWWNHGPSSDKVKYETVPGGKRWKVPGKTSKEQIEHIGPPAYSSDLLSAIQETGSFVKTNIVHAVERSGSRRFIISARLFHPWDEICRKVNTVSTNE